MGFSRNPEQRSVLSSLVGITILLLRKGANYLPAVSWVGYLAPPMILIGDCS